MTRTNGAGRLIAVGKLRESTSVKSLGELIQRRRQELGLTQIELGRRLKGRSGAPLSQVRVIDIESGRFGVPRLPILKQLPRALRLDPDVIYFWGGLVPPDIRVSGLSEATIKKGWYVLRALGARRSKTSGLQAAGKKGAPPSRATLASGQVGVLRGWGGRHTLGSLINWRRRELGLTRLALSQRIKGSKGAPLSQARITDIEYDRFGVPRAPLLKQLARVLKLDIDVLYLWARRIPPAIRPVGLSEAAIKEAWRAFRAVIRRRKVRRRIRS